uniref:NME/NM23 family member 5 n=1 Tax=Equus asinus TaxID=9793 RepID=A0A9L0IYX4_EQUAS
MEISMPPPQIYVEKTLAIIKPDIVDKEEEIQDIILRSGFTIVQALVTTILFPVFMTLTIPGISYLAG